MCPGSVVKLIKQALRKYEWVKCGRCYISHLMND